MPINPDAVGMRGEPLRKSWTSTDELAVSMWEEGDRVLFQTKNQNDVVVFDQGVFTHS